MSHGISTKFRVDISLFRTGSYPIIQSYSPRGANSARTGESRWALPRTSMPVDLLYELLNNNRSTTNRTNLCAVDLCACALVIDIK